MSEDFAGAVVDAAISVPADSGSTGADSGSTGSTSVDTPEVGSTNEVDSEVGVEGTENSESEVEGKADLSTDGAAKDDVDKPVAPQVIREALKQLRDSSDDPKVKAAVKVLHGNYERYEAIRKELGNNPVAEVKSQQDFLRELAGVEAGKPITVAQAREAISGLQNTVELAQQSDDLLYSGDATLIENIVEDLKANNKMEALGKLTSPMVSALEANDPEGYVKFATNFTLKTLRSVGFVDSVNAMHRLAKESGNKAMLSQVEALGKWFNGLQEQEKQVAEEEKNKGAEDWQREKAQFAQKEVEKQQAEIASSAEKHNNTLLGKELAPFLKTPFFKAFKRENLIPLGNNIKAELYATLKSDSAYQTQMKAMFAQKNPDKAKIVEYHKARVESVAARIVRDVVQKMYPTYSKGGSAAGRIASAQASKDAASKVAAKSATTGKPIYVAQKPQWDSIDWSKDPQQLRFITGKAFLKDGRYVTWRKV